MAGYFLSSLKSLWTNSYKNLTDEPGMHAKIKEVRSYALIKLKEVRPKFGRQKYENKA